MKKCLKYVLGSLLILAPTIFAAATPTNRNSVNLQSMSLQDTGVISGDTFASSSASNASESASPYYINDIGAEDISDTLKGWNVNETVVAIIDTGAELSHEDLIDNIWVNEAELNGSENVDDDNNGYVDDIYGLDLIHKGEYLSSLPTNDPISGTALPKYDSPEDDSNTSHGTHVSGIVGMNRDNTLGYAGINHKTKIMILKAGSSSNSFRFANCIEAIEYAVKNGADVINMSFGSTTQSEAFASTLEEASQSCLLVAAAGNNGQASSAAPLYPASYPFIIGVMASGSDGKLWKNSNWNDTTPSCYDIICPGESILSTTRYNGYGEKSGTSMAAPMVAGSAAIIMGFLEANNEYKTRKDLLEDTKKYLMMSDMTFSYTAENGTTFLTPQLNLKQSICHAIKDIKATNPSPSPSFLPTPDVTPLATASPSTTPSSSPSFLPTPKETPDATDCPSLTPSPIPTAAQTIPPLTPSPIPTAVQTIPPQNTIQPSAIPSEPPLVPAPNPSSSPSPATELFPLVNIHPTTLPPQLTLQGKSKNGTSVVLTWRTTLLPSQRVIYRSAKKNTIGKRLAVVSAKNNYTDRSIAPGKTYYYRVFIDGRMSKPITVQIPRKVAISSLNHKKKNIWKLKWKHIKHCTRYQIRVYHPDTKTTTWYYTKKNHIRLRLAGKVSIKLRAQSVVSHGTYSGRYTRWIRNTSEIY